MFRTRVYVPDDYHRRTGNYSPGFITLARTDVASRAKKREVCRQSISSAWQSLQTRGYLRLVTLGSQMPRLRP
ncbi:MAG: hypothetical protein E6K24_01050 [Gammaproteobacteria bacterium]|nr:MAG: hypothetical protein E6K24_01050 [Gammaproteobacteria bacterium]